MISLKNICISTHVIYKSLLTVGFSFITLALSQINRSNGYEVSIYKSTPIVFWLLLILALICGTYVVVHQSFKQKIYKDKFWIIGIFLIGLCNIVLLLLPVIKGYMSYGRWDTPMHVGYVIDIVSSNEVPYYLIYPLIHVLAAEIFYFSQLPITAIIYLIIVFFLSMYPLFIYCLSNTIFEEKQKIILSMLLSTVLFLSYTNYQVLPNSFSIFFIPLLLYLYIRSKSKNIEFSILLVFFIFAYPLLHPLCTVFLILAFIFVEIFKQIYLWLSTRDSSVKFSSIMKNTSINVPLVISVIFTSWAYSHYGFFSRNVRGLASQLLNETTSLPSTAPSHTIAEGMISTFSRFGLQLSDIGELFFKMYGHTFVFLVYTLIACLIIIAKAYQSTKKEEFLFSLIGWFLLGSLLLVGNIFATILEFGFWRIIGFMIILCPIFVAYALYELYVEKEFCEYSTKRLFHSNMIFVIFIFSFASITGVLSTYPSPYVYQANQQITESEMNGLNWYYIHKNISISDMPLKMDYRFANMLFGSLWLDDRDDLTSAKIVPNNFGYMNNTTLGVSVNETYTAISKYDKLYFTEIYPQLNEFSENDFKTLYQDVTVSKLYSNNELDVLLVSEYHS